MLDLISRSGQRSSFLLIQQNCAIYFIIFDTRRVWSILVNRSGLYSRIPSVLDADAPIDFTGEGGREREKERGIREDKGVKVVRQSPLTDAASFPRSIHLETSFLRSTSGSIVE